MIKYILETSQLNAILHLLYKLFNIRITFFDLEDYELESFDIKPMTDFCSHMRKNQIFLNKCNKCNKDHLEEAKKNKTPLLYICHTGLYEAIIPLYNQNDYLGSLVFGQIRPKKIKTPIYCDKEAQKLFRKLSVYNKEYLENLAQLLKFISEYIIIKEIIKNKKKPWVEKLHTYIKENINKKITVNELARLSNKSRSFISHYFKNEFNLSPIKYIQQEKFRLASKKIVAGQSIKKTADEFSFYDEYHFSKVFKQFFGYSPSEFKKKTLNSNMHCIKKVSGIRKQSQQKPY